MDITSARVGPHEDASPPFCTSENELGLTSDRVSTIPLSPSPPHTRENSETPECNEPQIGSSRSVGKISDQKWATLQPGFQKIEEILRDLAQVTSLPVARISTLLRKNETIPTSNSVNHWNTYGSYFTMNIEEEISATYGTSPEDSTKGQTIRYILESL